MNLIGTAIVILAGAVATLSTGPSKELGSVIIVSGFVCFLLELFELRPYLTRGLHSSLGIRPNDRDSDQLKRQKNALQNDHTEI